MKNKIKNSGRELNTLNTNGKLALEHFFKDRAAVISLFVFSVIVLLCVFAPLLTPYLPSAIDQTLTIAAPSRAHILGTDKLGRDTFTRLLYGGRTTLKITFTAVAVSLLGLIPGIAAGFRGGNTDLVLSRINEVLSVIPAFLLAVFAECLFGWGKGYYKFAIGIAFIPQMMKVSRSLVMEIRSSEYIEAARALGVSPILIIIRHILRNILPSLIVFVFNTAAEALLLCTVMGYLGIGVNPPAPEWGSLVHEGYRLVISAPLQVIFPCIPVVLSVISLNLIGKGVHDAISDGTGGE